eukprot:1161927-Pelagomonas_calceolata.AAC.6
MVSSNTVHCTGSPQRAPSLRPASRPTTRSFSYQHVGKQGRKSPTQKITSTGKNHSPTSTWASRAKKSTPGRFAKKEYAAASIHHSACTSAVLSFEKAAGISRGSPCKPKVTRQSG